MKIIYILNNTTLVGGANKSFMTLLEAVARHHEVMVLCPDSRDIARVISSKGIPVKTLRFIDDIRPDHKSAKDIVLFVPRYIKRKTFNFIASRQLAAIARKFGADIIHTNTSVNDIGFRAARCAGIPHILHVREYGDKDFGIHIYGLSQRLRSPQAYSICITEDIRRHRGVESHPRSSVIYNPVVSGEMRYTSAKLPYILYVGRIDPGKGVADLIRAYILYARENPEPMTLKLAGLYKGAPHRQALKKQCERMIAQASLDDKVEWLGEIDNAPDLMYRARAIVIPSFFEGFGRVMPEAIANGCLPIGRDTAGTKEQFDNGLRLTGGEIGLRFTTIDELVRHLHDVTANPPEFYRSYIERGRDTVGRLYTAQSSTAATLALYDRIMADRHL